MPFLITLFLLANVATAAEVPLAVAPIGPASGYRTAATAASNGRGFLVVSRESRERWGLFGMRADDRGRPIDSVMFRIADETDDGPIGVASDGDSYLVAWSTWNTSRTRLARVDDEGHVTLCGELPKSFFLSLAWGGSAYVLAYADLSNDSTGVAVIGSDGTLLRSQSPLVTGNFNPGSPRLAAGAAPGTVIVTWSGYDNIVHATAVHTKALRDGSYVAPAWDGSQPAPLYTEIGPASIASNGNQSLVVWPAMTTPLQVQPGAISTTRIRARRLDVDGAPIGNVFELAKFDHVHWSSVQISVAWNGTGFVVGFSRLTDLGGTLLSVSPDDHVTTLHDFSNPGFDTPLVTLAGSDRGALYVWNDGQLHGALADSVLGAPQLFSLATASQSQPGIAWCGDAYRAVWIEESDKKRVLFGRAAANGLPLDGAGIRIRESSLPQNNPKIACSASNALVAWSEYDWHTGNVFMRAALVDADGTAHAPIDFGPSFSGGPAVVWNGSEYLVAWETSWQQIALVRVSHDGQPIDATPQLLPAAGSSTGVSVAWNGAEYLVASSRIVRLSPSLTPIGSTRALSASDASTPIAIAGNGEWLVAWSEGANGRFSRLTSALDEIEHGSMDGHPSDGAFTASGYRIVTDGAAISHGALIAAVIRPRITSELFTRLYISIDAGRMRPMRR